ncbi:MAG: hypothetical protein H5T61_09980 [Thermoflexales bacterium]|nr:hypothetical protein [Thermoflexales bacterium]
MEQSAFFEQVRKHFRYLESYGFGIAYEEIFTGFDNAEVVFQSEKCRIRVLLERGEVYVDIGPLPPTEYWVDLAILVEFLTQGAETWQYEIPTGDYQFRVEWQLARVANKLRHYILQACEMFSIENFEHKRLELERFKQQRLLKRWGNHIDR